MQEIIHKYLKNEASEQEVEMLFDWIESSEANKKYFIEIKKTWALTGLAKKTETKVVPLRTIQSKTAVYFRYAAMFLILLGIGSLVFNFNENSKEAKAKEILLELGDGQKEYVTKENQINLVDEKGNLIAKKDSTQIVYFGKVNDKDVKYNTLSIPYGKKFKVILSDGTQVTMNSGTVLRYPEQFGKNSNRKVYLTGEAFFEVTKDKKHPFIVNVNDVDIKVLGTKFNVSAYPEDLVVKSALVEGSIQFKEVKNESNAVILVPNQMVTWNKNAKKIAVSHVDTSFYTAWVNGEMVFRDTPFSEIAKIIERNYDVKIVNKSTELAKQSFTGAININESTVENILELLKRDTPFQYSITNNAITIINTP
ncbi:FecR family protein [Flavobacterium flavipallidum]|uniref:FecR domain-containing protein n=1 Tax=Flavobacterium flavipallidum TaxID=3139140 RepID=A0ABU9HQJ0_9FLAO